jgi:acyl-CoA dehydrogenase
MSSDPSMQIEPETLKGLVERTARFVRETVVPMEGSQGPHGIEESTRVALQDAARAAGVFAPHSPKEFGGLGLDSRAQAQVFEAAGHSLLGPLAINAAAPDEGNIHMLNVIANGEQRDEFLGPLARGEVRSCFAMTEPAPGAGSDPAGLRTTAVKDGSDWIINGRKWYITGATGAAFAIVMARTSEIRGRLGATMFLVDTDAPGWNLLRVTEGLDTAFVGGHGEIELRDVRVPESRILGEVDEGFQYAQVRLAPARLTHCMRWLGIAVRSQEIALERSHERELFGSRLADLGLAQHLLADNEIDIETSRAIIGVAAAQLDARDDARQATSIAKVYVSEAVNRVVDRSLQICGSLGISDDLPLGRFLREVRGFRIYDGPSEAHRWAIARRAVRQTVRRIEQTQP